MNDGDYTDDYHNTIVYNSLLPHVTIINSLLSPIMIQWSYFNNSI